MKLVDRCIQAPVGVAVGVILVVLFGALSFFRIPVQLTPDVDSPQITVETLWPGASPNEVEREIVDRQEDQLKNVEGLVRMTSESKDSVGTVILEFPVGSDMDAARLRVANSLDQVPRKPTLAEEPVITGVDPTASAVAWITVKRLPGNQRPMNEYRTFCSEIIKPALERVPGVARSNVFGGTEQELRITIDPRKLSALQLTITQVMSALRGENRDISAGNFDEGKRRYTVRTLGQFTSPADAEAIIIAKQDDRIVRLSDVGHASLSYAKADFNVRHFGSPSIAINCQRASGANVIEVMEGIKRTIHALNEGPMKDQQLVMKQVYDETIYIQSAIALVKQNIFVGGILAVAVLFLFLRSFSAVGIIAVAIPVSIVGTFLVMSAMGRNLNVISLAGMSFAVGMVVDNAIVVLENIVRHRQMGKDRAQAASEGANEVWGAVIASTLTTMAVFIPIVFMKEEIGQLYRDIAIAISASVGLSMIVAVSVIPTMAARVGRRHKARGVMGDSTRNVSPLDRFGAAMTSRVSSFVYAICGPLWTRLLITVALTMASLFFARLMLPSAEYLPQGNRNLIFCILLPPPGYNLDELAHIGEGIESELKPYFRFYDNAPVEHPTTPVIENFFYVARGRNVFMGAIAEDPDSVRQLIPILQAELNKVPGMIAIVQQASLFGRSIGQGRNIDIDITGPDLNELVGLGGRIFGQLFGVLPGSMNRPIPGLDLGNPEVHIVPDRVMMSKLGLSSEEIGVAVDVMLDGRKVDDYKHEGLEIDLILAGIDALTARSQDFENLPIVTASGRVVPLGDLARVEVTAGPEQINHIERRRAVTIRVIPAAEVPMDVAMSKINNEIVAPLQKEGAIGGANQIHLAGTADDLVVTLDALKWNFLLAVVIAYLLMAALFESFLYPLVIMFSVPLAAVGGLMGLKLVNLGLRMAGTGLDQPMDTLTMLGFIILVGTVINNAILIVHQALNNIRRDNMNNRDAIRESVRSRIRPIFMSMTTSVLGMMPLVLFPGAGSELYRGIGSVVIGGLVVSTVFTLILVPALFSLVLSMSERARSWPAKQAQATVAILTLCLLLPARSHAETESAWIPTNGTFVLSLDRCMELTLGGNIQLQIESRLPLIRGEDYFVAEETFTPFFAGSVGLRDSETRTVNTQVGAEILAEETTTADARVSKRWLPGTRTDLIWAYERRADNSEYRTVNPAHRHSVVLELTQPLLKGFGGAINRLDLERAVRGHNAADKAYEISIEAELLNTYQRYWQLVRASSAATHREIAYAAAVSAFDFVTQQRAAGAISEPEHLTASAELATAKERLAQANAAYARASNELMLQIRPMSDMPQTLQIIPSSQLQQTHVATREPDLKSSIETALAERPEMGLYEIEMDLRGLDLVEAGNNRKPRLDLQAAFGPNGLGSDFSSGLDDLSARNNEWRVGLALAFLFDSESRKARWRQAVFNEESAALRMQLARATIAADVNASIIDIREANTAVTAALQGMQAAERRLSLARDKMDVGMLTRRDVLMTERDLAEAAYRMTLAQTQQLLTHAQHQAALGRFSKWVMAKPGE